MVRYFLLVLVLLLTGASIRVDAAAQPITPPSTLRAGTYKIETSLREIFGDQALPDFERTVKPDEALYYTIHVPEGYDPAKPPGVVVYTSPFDTGSVPNDWESVLNEANLIWVSANESGNDREALRRVVEAIAGLALVRHDYRVDSSRFYAVGFSGGGRISSFVMMYFPDTFAGAIYICGIIPISKADQPMVEQMKANRYVFLTGTGDEKRFDLRRAYREYESAGFADILYIEVPMMEHDNPDTAHFSQAIGWLDGAGRAGEIEQ